MAGLMIGHDTPRFTTGASRLQATAVWHLADFLLQGFVFLLIGQQILPVVRGLKAYPAATIVSAVLLTLAGDGTAPGSAGSAGREAGSAGREAALEARRAVIDAQREELLRWRDAGRLPDASLRVLERELDHEERIVPGPDGH